MDVNESSTETETTAEEKWSYEPPVIRSGEAFETVLLGSGCNQNWNLQFGCSEPNPC